MLRIARENAKWGYDRIQGVLADLGHIIAPNTVENILKRYGDEPEPARGRRTSWRTFLKAHWAVMVAMATELLIDLHRYAPIAKAWISCFHINTIIQQGQRLEPTNPNRPRDIPVAFEI